MHKHWQHQLSERPELYPSYLRWNGASFQEWVDRTRPAAAGAAPAVYNNPGGNSRQGNSERDVAYSP